MSSFAKEYIKCKEAFDEYQSEAFAKVRNIYCKYAEGKSKVSKNSWNWFNFSVDSFKITEKYLGIQLVWSYSGGGCEYQHLKFPVIWLDYSDDELDKAVSERLEEERIDIERREAIREAKKKEEIVEREKALLASLKAKYE